MTSKQSVDGFLDQTVIAVAGVSRSGRGFGAMAYRALKNAGYKALAVNPNGGSIDGAPIHPSFAALPEAAGAALVVTPPGESAKVVQDAAAAGIRRVWLQQGAVSPEATGWCSANGIDAVSGECILMFLAPEKFPHNFHRWIWRKLGKLPR
ncbi:MAG: CoA-binding protein [Acidobacteriales bacterium]|nr:CoA-binding protein [Terriglobales bacterium]